MEYIKESALGGDGNQGMADWGRAGQGIQLPDSASRATRHERALAAVLEQAAALSAAAAEQAAGQWVERVNRAPVRDAMREGPHRFGMLIGGSRPMQMVYQHISRVAPTDATVFIIGESGTGKELAAQTIHQYSQRRSGPFLAVNCGAISAQLIESELFGHEKGSFTGAHRQHSGFFEQARGGTLFLDEITEMPLELQVKLLRVLENRTFMRVGSVEAQPLDVRIIAASNRRPLEAVAEGRFREDLLYRLHVFPLHMPRLQDRLDDLPVLARHFLQQLQSSCGGRRSLSPAALERLRQMAWPGNVRQLKNVLHRACILSDGLITPSCLHDPLTVDIPPAEADGGPSLNIRIGRPLCEIEKTVILATLKQCNGRREEAASMLGLSLKTLYNRLREYRAAGQGTV